MDIVAGVKNFTKDLELGKKFENFFGSWLESKLPGSSIEYCDNGDWDILWKHPDGRKKSYELKADFRSEETGNAFIEFSGWGNQPSGIRKSKADMWIHLFKWKIYKCPLTTLKEKVERHSKGIVDTLYHKSNGDEISARGFIISEFYFRKLFIPVEGINDFRLYLEKGESE